MRIHITDFYEKNIFQSIQSKPKLNNKIDYQQHFKSYRTGTYFLKVKRFTNLFVTSSLTASVAEPGHFGRSLFERSAPAYMKKNKNLNALLIFYSNKNGAGKKTDPLHNTGHTCSWSRTVEGRLRFHPQKKEGDNGSATLEPLSLMWNPSSAILISDYLPGVLDEGEASVHELVDKVLQICRLHQALMLNLGQI